MGRSSSRFAVTLIAALVGAGTTHVAQAAESGFTIYPLGSMAFGSGTPTPPGWYVTTAVGYYPANFRANNLIGGVATAGLNVRFLEPQLNILYAPTEKFLGGQLGFSVNVPTGCLAIDAAVVAGPFNRSASAFGCGLGDMWGRAQLGWTLGDFSHTLYVTGFAPTGRYDAGFNPNIGLNRPAGDVTWAATWLERATSIEFSAAVGYTVNATNTITQYKSGDDFHFEWAVGRKFGPQWTVGFAGYNYVQVTGDSGPGAVLGAFKGQTNGAGPAVSFVTEIEKHVVVFNARVYFEYDVINRFQGTTSLASATVRF